MKQTAYPRGAQKCCARIVRTLTRCTLTIRAQTALVLLAPLALAPLALGSCASGPLKQYKVQALYGMIYDLSNKPVGGVTLSINGKHAASSDIHGRFAIPQMKPKLTYTVLAEKEHYETAELRISFSDPTHVLYLQMLSGTDLLTEAERALAEKDWFKAESFLSRAERAGADLLPLGYLRGVLALHQGRDEEALTLLLDLAEREKSSPFVLLFIADLYQYRFKDADRARHFLQKLLELQDVPAAQSRLSLLLENAGSIEQER